MEWLTLLLSNTNLVFVIPTKEKFPLVTGEIYHVFNRGIDKRITFANSADFGRGIQTIRLYRFSSPIKLSRLFSLSIATQMSIIDKLSEANNKLVDIICYCLMPNHFHFLLKQLVDRGISLFLSQFENSYTRYFNTKNDRIGQLFLDRFKHVRIENNDQLFHVNRYIHLNPYSSDLVQNYDGLLSYPWSSLPEYLNLSQENICEKEIIMSDFKSTESYKDFILDQADYQRELDRIKHLLIDAE